MQTLLTTELSLSASPQRLFEHISGQRYPFFLDSRGGPNAAYSLLGCNPSRLFRSLGETVELSDNGDNWHTVPGKPIEVLRSLLAERKITAPPFPGCTGAFGYVSYDFCRQLENLPQKNLPDLPTYDLFFGFYDTILVFEHTTKKWSLCRHPRSAPDGNNFIKILPSCMDERPDQETVSARYVGTNIPEPYFHDIVRRTKEYIKAGDIYQTNLSQRLHLELESDPYRFYDVLLGINPSPFSAFLRFGRLTIGSCSPERLFKVTRKRLETRPIAGTRRRGKTPEEDSEMYSELIKSEKERAEHLMLVDLERNDMGRVCRYGTVHVDEFMVREAYSHVWHIVSNITGELRPELDALDALTALFPGGTITGAPKIRAMEIIEEMEPVRRGLYTGSIGYIADSGDADFSIVIRTFILHEKNAYIQVGSGIVADSDPHLEYRESLNKAAALLKAAGVTV